MILAHMAMNKQTEQMNGGKANLKQTEMDGANVEKGSGYGRQNGRQANSPQNKPLQADTTGGVSARHGPQNKRPEMASLAANNSCRRRPVPLAVQVSGGSTVVLAAMKAGSDLPTVPTPPIAFACHCPYPLP